MTFEVHLKNGCELSDRALRRCTLQREKRIVDAGVGTSDTIQTSRLHEMFAEPVRHRDEEEISGESDEPIKLRGPFRNPHTHAEVS
jgi:hypothetical protein